MVIKVFVLVQTGKCMYLNHLRVRRQSLTYRGAMLNINRYRLRASSCPDIYRNSMTTIAIEEETASGRQNKNYFSKNI